jgi:HAD superfamily hydrolase (TIGR01509 family)
MDGTMVNTEPLHARAATIVLQDLGIDFDLMKCIDKYYGMTDAAILKIECPQFSDQQIDETISQKNEKLIHLFNELANEEKSQYITPGLIDFLAHLQAENKNIAVVSASEDIIVTETLKCFNLSRFIPLQMGRGQTVKTKPHPDPYIEAMNRLKSSPQETLIFEDSPTGLAAASASKAQVVRITGFIHAYQKSNHIEFKNFLT